MAGRAGAPASSRRRSFAHRSTAETTSWMPRTVGSAAVYRCSRAASISTVASIGTSSVEARPRKSSKISRLRAMLAGMPDGPNQPPGMSSTVSGKRNRPAPLIRGLTA